MFIFRHTRLYVRKTIFSVFLVVRTVVVVIISVLIAVHFTFMQFYSLLFNLNSSHMYDVDSV
jgi:uncharacterized membrane protein